MGFDTMTLEADGTEQSFTALGFDWASSVQEINNQAAGTFSVARPGADITDDPLFAFEDWVIIRSGRTGTGTSWTGGRIEFQGRMIKTMLEGSPARDVVFYQFQDPWYDLEVTPYQQPVMGWVGTPSAILSSVSTSEVLLFADYTSGGWIASNIGDMATKILQYLLDTYTALSETAPYQIGTIDITAPRNSYQTRDMKCGEVLRMCLTGAPDANIWFDYTFSPPKLNITSRANLTAVTCSFAAGTDQKQIRITPRPDLIPASIIIWFKITGSNDGLATVQYIKDKYPSAGPDAGRNVVIQTVDMQGAQVTSAKGNLECISCDANSGTFATKRAWWARHLPEFAGFKYRFPSSWSVAGISNATILDETGTAVSLSDFPNELLDGSNICPWMTLADSTPITGKRVTITALAAFDEYDVTGTDDNDISTGNKLNRYVSRLISVHITLTNGITGNYSALQSSIAGEPVPSGMAQGMYLACAALQYEANDVRVDPSVRVEMGNAVNLSGGRTEWATMLAQPQTIRRQFGQGYVEISFGPPKHLSAADLTQMFLVNRYRKSIFMVAPRADGSGGGDASVTLGKNSPRNNSNSSAVQQLELLSTQYLDPTRPTLAPLAQIQLDAKAMAALIPESFYPSTPVMKPTVICVMVGSKKMAGVTMLSQLWDPSTGMTDSEVETTDNEKQTTDK